MNCQRIIKIIHKVLHEVMDGKFNEIPKSSLLINTKEAYLINFIFTYLMKFIAFCEVEENFAVKKNYLWFSSLRI